MVKIYLEDNEVRKIRSGLTHLIPVLEAIAENYCATGVKEDLESIKLLNNKIEYEIKLQSTVNNWDPNCFL